MVVEVCLQQFMFSQQGVLMIVILKVWDIVIYCSMDCVDEGNEE